MELELIYENMLSEGYVTLEPSEIEKLVQSNGIEKGAKEIIDMAFKSYDIQMGAEDCTEFFIYQEVIDDLETRLHKKEYNTIFDRARGWAVTLYRFSFLSKMQN